MTQYVARWADGTQVLFRALNWQEYRTFRQRLLTQPLGVSLDVYEAVVLEGPKLEQIPAGIVRSITDFLMRDNAFSGSYRDIKKTLEAARKGLGDNYLNSARALIAHLFRYSFEEMDKWDQETFFRRLAAAEFVAGKPLEPVNPDEKQDKRRLRPPKQLTEGQKLVLERVRTSR